MVSLLTLDEASASPKVKISPIFISTPIQMHILP